MSGLQIAVVETDPDYIGLEVRASTARYAATTFIYGQPADLMVAADVVATFSAALGPDASLELGTLDPGYASGFCGLTLHAADALGHVEVRVHVHDAEGRFDDSRAVLRFPTEPGALDRFASGLRHIAEARSGSAVLESSA